LEQHEHNLVVIVNKQQSILRQEINIDKILTVYLFFFDELPLILEYDPLSRLHFYCPSRNLPYSKNSKCKLPIIIHLFNKVYHNLAKKTLIMIAKATI